MLADVWQGKVMMERSEAIQCLSIDWQFVRPDMDVRLACLLSKEHEVVAVRAGLKPAQVRADGQVRCQPLGHEFAWGGGAPWGQAFAFVAGGTNFRDMGTGW